MLSLLAAIVFRPQAPWPQTKAEATNFRETSSYSDVVAFIHGLQDRGAPISLEYFGTSKEGKRMPLVIASRPLISTPGEAKRSGKPIVYVQANIHGGEVEGKEASLALLRDLAKEKSGLLDRIILVVAPIYNIDGNEKLGPEAVNRPEQNGPPMVGHRESGEGFDLNRDGMKAESVEFRALLERVWNLWDPDVMMDLHTTDGTRHGYDLTYAPPLNPNTPAPILGFSRDEMLPAVRRDMRRRFKTELFDYGDNEKQSWRTFGEGGRYMTNYAGLRNRIGILSEAATYIPFRERVEVTYRFTTSILDYVAAHSREVLNLTRTTPEPTAELGVRFEMASRGEEETLLEPPPPAGQKRPETGRPASLIKVKMPIFDRFRATKTASVPYAYLIPAKEKRVVDLLLRHGIVVERLVAPPKSDALRFKIGKCAVANSTFQGHRLITLDGAFESVDALPFPQSDLVYMVRAQQPLLPLIFNLLEPESTDGVAAWGYLSHIPAVGEYYPILKAPKSFPVRSERLP